MRPGAFGHLRRTALCLAAALPLVACPPDDRPGLRFSNRIEVHDPSSDAWSPHGEMPVNWHRPATAAVGGRIYLAGGFHRARILGYDPIGDARESLPSVLTYRRSFEMIAVGPLIYVLGGYRGSSSLDTVEIFDTVRESWTPGVSMTV